RQSAKPRVDQPGSEVLLVGLGHALMRVDDRGCCRKHRLRCRISARLSLRFAVTSEDSRLEQPAVLSAVRASTDSRGCVAKRTRRSRPAGGRLAAIKSVASGSPARYLVDGCFPVRLVPRARVYID